MKSRLRILSAIPCFLVALPCLAAGGHPGSDPFATFARFLAKPDELTPFKIATSIDRLSAKHGLPVAQGAQQTWVLATNDGKGFDFGDGVVVESIRMNVLAVTLDLSQTPCTRMSTLARLLGPGWQPATVPDAYSLESYNKGPYHAIVKLASPSGRLPECVMRVEITRDYFYPG